MTRSRELFDESESQPKISSWYLFPRGSAHQMSRLSFPLARSPPKFPGVSSKSPSPASSLSSEHTLPQIGFSTGITSEDPGRIQQHYERCHVSDFRLSCHQVAFRTQKTKSLRMRDSPNHCHHKQPSPRFIRSLLRVCSCGRLQHTQIPDQYDHILQ